jgi:uncharacterized membrane protein
MARAIIGGIVGYLVMAVSLFVAFTVAYLIMKADGAFKPGVYEVSTTWLITSFVVGLVCAIIGGLVCALIARPGSKAPMVLAVVVLVLGLLMAVPHMMSEEEETPAVREGDVSVLEAMQVAEPPLISLLLNPVLGAVGIVIGAKLRGGGKAGAAPAA